MTGGGLGLGGEYVLFQYLLGGFNALLLNACGKFNHYRDNTLLTVGN